jgi:hypothetical protein
MASVSCPLASGRSASPGIGPQIVVPPRTFDVVRDRREPGAPDEAGRRPDQAEVRAEPAPRGLVRGVDAQLELDAGDVVARPLDAQCPGDPDVARLGEGREFRRVRNVDERDLGLPYLADRADRDFLGRVVDEDAEPGPLGRRDQVVQPEARVRTAPREPLRDLPQREQRACDRRVREVTVPDALPCALRIGGDIDVIDLEQAGRRNEPIERAHGHLPESSPVPRRSDSSRTHASRHLRAVHLQA